LLDRTLENLYVEGGQTTLLDAIGSIAGSLDRQSTDATKVIIVITDGEDRLSAISKKQLVEQLKQRHVTLFAVGLVEALEEHKSKAVDLLTELTRETGGRAVFPRSKSASASEVLAELNLPIQ
jgi:Mg-chelatase subunit ChlD